RGERQTRFEETGSASRRDRAVEEGAGLGGKRTRRGGERKGRGERESHRRHEGAQSVAGRVEDVEAGAGTRPGARHGKHRFKDEARAGGKDGAGNQRGQTEEGTGSRRRETAGRAVAAAIGGQPETEQGIRSHGGRFA